MKTTTIAVLVLSSAAVFSRREYAHCFGRRISYDVIRQAAAVFLMYMTPPFFLGGGMIISKVEDLPLLACLSETASAIGHRGFVSGDYAGAGSGVEDDTHDTHVFRQSGRSDTDFRGGFPGEKFVETSGRKDYSGMTMQRR